MLLRTPLLTARTAAAVLCLLLASVAQAQWKWKDGTGRVQYSDTPPPRSVPEKDILQKPAAAARAALPPAAPASAASAPSPAASGVDQELETRKREAEAAEAAKRKAEETRVAAEKADNCQRARVYLRTLDDGQRISRTNARGEREFLDDQQRAAERIRTNQAIAKNCS
jgi:hypothetical protein